MTIACTAPDPDLGVAIRLSSYLDCQSRALGENGFQALTGGPVVSGLLAGTITIFIALIGYRMILGAMPGIRDGIGWAVRLGVVLALVTSWPAFQALVYRVATDGPEELSAILLPAIGVPEAAIGERVQGVYDMIRLGTAPEAAPQAPAAAPQGAGAAATPAPAPSPATMASTTNGLAPLPQTASLLVISTLGLSGALRLAVGFLVAIAPIAILCLLFDASLGIFNGWVRALAGAALGVLATSVSSAIELVAVETELLHVQAAGSGAAAASSLDPQALVTTILVFTVVALVAVFAAMRVGGAFRMTIAMPALAGGGPSTGHAVGNETPASRAQATREAATSSPGRARATIVADALASAAYRDQAQLSGAGSSDAGGRRTILSRQDDKTMMTAPVPLGVAGRRSTARRTQSAARRDRQA